MLLLLPLLALLAGRVEAHAVPSLEGIQSQAELDKAITALDAALFDSYIRCDLEKFASFFADDVEFYHDRTGFHSGPQVRADFARLAATCPGGRGVTRELIPGTLRVYPIHDYGAVQMGMHRFIEKGSSTATVAQFVHLWQRKDGAWKISRALSFEHHVADAP